MAIKVMKWKVFEILISDTDLEDIKNWIDVAKEFRKIYPDWKIIWTSAVQTDNLKNKWQWNCDIFCSKIKLPDIIKKL
jgi:hypothetical protein